jgi:hypothetical protein
MKNILIPALFSVLIFSACSEKVQSKNDFIIAQGQMPAIVKDNNNVLHLVFGSGDSIMYARSTDNGSTFSTASLIKEIPHVFTFAMRGPQLAATGKGIILTACTAEGNIYSFYKVDGSGWQQGSNVNDKDTVCKEGLMALSAYDNNAFAVWLDLRGNQRNKIYGARSVDGGKTWGKNFLIYASPDSTVCECCKPSVVVWKNKVAVMFRNWLGGNRDLYLVQSNDTGNSFGAAEKLGTGSWKINACPMDGGNITVNNNGEIRSVWRRELNVYADKPGTPEAIIGEGKNCTIETTNDSSVYAWVENGKIVIRKPGGEKKPVGEGNQPVLKTIDNKHIICVWENDRQIHAAVLQL